jgi:hypothetical protein
LRPFFFSVAVLPRTMGRPRYDNSHRGRTTP